MAIFYRLSNTCKVVDQRAERHVLRQVPDVLIPIYPDQVTFRAVSDINVWRLKKIILQNVKIQALRKIRLYKVMIKFADFFLIQVFQLFGHPTVFV